jgi:hypothetical protein
VPVLLRSLVRGPGHGLAMLLALLFTVTAAVGLGWLSGGPSHRGRWGPALRLAPGRWAA